MKRKQGMRCMEDGGLIGQATNALSSRQKILDAAEAQAVGVRPAAPPPTTPPTALGPKKPVTVSEAEALSARFKWERENPGVPYVPPKKADGGMVSPPGSLAMMVMANGGTVGYVPFNSNSPFLNSTAHSKIVHAPPQLGLQNGLYGGYADGGKVDTGHPPFMEQNGFYGNPGPAKTTWQFPPDGGVRGLGGAPVGYADGGWVGRGTNYDQPSVLSGGSITAAPVSPLQNFQRVSASDLTSMATGVSDGKYAPTPSVEGLARAQAQPANYGAQMAAGAGDASAVRASRSLPERIIQPPSVSGFKYTPGMRSFDPNSTAYLSGQAMQNAQNGADAQWNNMAAAFDKSAPIADRIANNVSRSGYPMLANGGAVPGLRLGHALGEGYRQKAITSKAMIRHHKEMKRLADGGGVSEAPARGHMKQDMKKYANGGGIGKMKMSAPGKITGVGGPTEDKQPILASPGEFIVPADSVKRIGEDKLQSMVDATHTPAHGGEGMRGVNFVGGGPIVDDFGMLVDPVTGQPATAAPAEPVGGFAKAKSAVGGATNTVVDTGKEIGKKVKRGFIGLRNRMASDQRQPNNPLPDPDRAGPQVKTKLPEPPRMSVDDPFIKNMKPGENAFAARNIAAEQGLPPGEASRFSRTTPLQTPLGTSAGLSAEEAAAETARAAARRAATTGGFDASIEGIRKPGFFENMGNRWRSQGGFDQFGKQVIPDQPGEGFKGSEAFKGAGQPGKLVRGVRTLGRATPLIEGGLQAYGAAEDMKYLTPDEQRQRAAEAMINTGLGGLGAVAGGTGGTLVAGPVGGAAGAVGLGTVGGGALPWIDRKLNELGLTDRVYLAQNIAAERRAQDEFVKGRLAEHEAKAKAAAAPAAAPEAPAVAPAATETATDRGDQGYHMPTLDSGAPAQPTLDEMKAKWANESAAIDNRARESNRQAALGAYGMRLQNDANVAAYERGRDTDPISTAPRLAPGRAQAAIARDNAAKAALGGFYQGQQAEGIADKQIQASRLNHADQLAAARYGADTGLRGHMYTANANLLAHQMSNKLGYLQLQQQIGEKNLGDIEKMIADRSQSFTVDKEGKQVPDLAGSQAKAEAFRRFVMTTNTLNPADLQKRFGVSRVQDISAPMWSAEFDRLNAQLALSKNASMDGRHTIEGPVKGVRVKPREIGDAWEWPGGPIQPGGSTMGWLNSKMPWSPMEDRYTGITYGEGGLGTSKPLSELVTNRQTAEAYIHALEQSGASPKDINDFKVRWNLQ